MIRINPWSLKISKKIALVIVLAISIAACGQSIVNSPNSSNNEDVRGVPLDVAISPLSALESPLSVDAVNALDNFELENEPESGMGTVFGRLTSSETGQPIVDALVRLPEVYCPEGIEEADKREQCFWALDNAFSPSSATDENGIFVFDSVAAREYVFMVGDIMGDYTVFLDPQGRPFIYAVESNGVLELGTIEIGDM